MLMMKLRGNKIIPMLGSRPALVDEDVSKRRSCISDVRALLKGKENLANKTVYPRWIVVLVWLPVFIELLLAGIDRGVVRFIINQQERFVACRRPSRCGILGTRAPSDPIHQVLENAGVLLDHE